MEFQPFPKMARLSRECFVLEKIDGSNASILIKPACEFEGTEDTSLALGVFDGNVVFAGSRTRWIYPGKSTDNFGFAAWVCANISELLKLGPGHHFGEFWGRGIQRTYGLDDRRFSLFNAGRWSPAPLGNGVIDTFDAENPRLGPSCCSVVPTLYRGEFRSDAVEECLRVLKETGSRAALGFREPEGVIVYHTAAGIGFKKTLDGDEAKGVAK